MEWMIVADKPDVVVGFVEAKTPEQAIVEWAGSHADDEAFYVVEAEHVRRFEPQIPHVTRARSAAIEGGELMSLFETWRRWRNRPWYWRCLTCGAASRFRSDLRHTRVCADIPEYRREVPFRA